MYKAKLNVIIAQLVKVLQGIASSLVSVLFKPDFFGLLSND